MSMIEVRLFELSRKGERLDELNAEEVFNRQAKAAARRQAFRTLVNRLGTRFGKTNTTARAEHSGAILSPQRQG